MLIVNLAGGLGNQMFQYGMGLSLANRTGIPVLYSSTFSQYSSSPTTIESVFNLDIEWCGLNDIQSCIGLLRSSAFARRLLGKASRITKRQFGSKFKAEIFEGYEEITIPDFTTNYYLHGYWQSELYFDTDFSELKDKFTFREKRFVHEISPDISENDTKIGIHLRRGDYITNTRASKKLGTPANQYYVDAIMRLRGKFMKSKIIVFSDDIDWAKDFLFPLFDEIYFSDLPGSTASSDMQMLSQCDHFVLSNSTFGWWSAYLATNPDKIVITPENWFIDGSYDRDIVPTSWLAS